MVPLRSLYFVRFKAQLLFCLPACHSLSLCKLEEAGGRRCRRMENEHLALLTNSAQWVPDRARGFEVSSAGSLSPFRPFLYMLLSPKKMKRVSGALRRWELFLKVHSRPRSPDRSSRAKKGRGQLSQLSHSFPACCLI